MKNFLLSMMVLTFAFGFLNAQKYEVRISSGIGISTSNIDSKSDWVEYEFHTRSIPICLDVNYKMLSRNRWDFYVGSGLKFISHGYLQNIKSLEYGYNIRALNFHQSNVVLPFRLSTEWKFFGANAFGFQYEFLYNFAAKREFVLGTEDFEHAINGSLQYSYSLTGKVKNFISSSLGLYIKTQLSESLHFISSIDYEIRPVTGNISFSTDQVQYETDDNTGIVVSKTKGSRYENHAIEHSLLYFKVGLVKRF